MLRLKPVDPKCTVVVYSVRHRIALGAEHCGAGLNGYHARGIISIDAGELKLSFCGSILSLIV